jgi:hypothetical protein
VNFQTPSIFHKSSLGTHGSSQPGRRGLEWALLTHRRRSSFPSTAGNSEEFHQPSAFHCILTLSQVA